MIRRDDCIGSIREASGNTLSEAEALDVLRAVEARRKAVEGQIGADDTIRRFARDQAEAARIKAAQDRWIAARTAIVRDQLGQHITTLRGQGFKRSRILQGLLEGMSWAGTGTRTSAHAMQVAYRQRYHGTMAAGLDKLGRDVWTRLRDEGFNERVAREMAEPGSTGDTMAGEVGKLFLDLKERARQDLNGLGAFIGKLDDHVLPHAHEPFRLAKAGQDAWVNSILERLDLERTFPDLTPAEMRDVLADIWLTVTTGRDRHLKPEGFRAPANMARSLAKERQLHFKSVDDWLAYNREFGVGNTTAIMHGHLARAAETAGMMELFGPNPALMIQRLADELGHEVRNSPEARTDVGRAEIAALGTVQTWASYKLVTREQDLIANAALASFGQGVRIWQQISKLGGVILAALPDTVTSAANLRFQGKGFTAAYGSVLAKTLQGRGTGDERHVAFLVGQGADGLLGRLVTPYAAEEQAVGKLAKLSTLFFRLNGLTAWTDVQRSVAARIMAADMGTHAAKTWEALPIRYRNVLDQQGITAERWEVIRQAAWTGEDGTRWLTPDRIQELDDDVIEPLARQRLSEAQLVLADRWAARRQADRREAGWVAKRALRLAEKMTAAEARLAERLAKMKERGAERAGVLENRIAAIGGQLSEIAEFFGEVAGGIGERRARRAGFDEGWAERRIAELQRDIAQLDRDITRIAKGEAADFAVTWRKRQDELIEFTRRVKRQTDARAAAQTAEDAKWPAMMAKIIQRERDRLELDARRFFGDEISTSIIDFDPRAQKVVAAGQARGTLAGEALRIVWQFKGYPLAFSRRIIGRTLFGGPRYATKAETLLRNGAHAGELLAMLTVAGAVSMWAKDLAKGRTPKALFADDGGLNFATIGAAMAQGGALGIYGDFLFGEANRYGKGFIESLLGPGVGAASELGGIVVGAIRDSGRLTLGQVAEETSAGKVLSFTLANTPFANLFYARPALDWLFLNSLREAASPGYFRREDRRLREQFGQRRLTTEDLGL